MSSQTATTASRRNRYLSELNASSGKVTPRFTTSAGRRRAKSVAKSATEWAIPLCACTTSTPRSSTRRARRRALATSNSCFKGRGKNSIPSARQRSATSPPGRETTPTRCPRRASPRASSNIWTTLPVVKLPFSSTWRTESCRSRAPSLVSIRPLVGAPVRDEHDLSELPPLLEEPIRRGSLRERQNLVDPRHELSGADGGEERAKLPVVRHRRAQDRDVLPVDEADLFGRVRPRRRTAGDDPPAAPHRLQRRHPRFLADGVHDDIHAAARRLPSDDLSDVLGGVVDDDPGAGGAGLFRLLLPGRRREHLGAAEESDLERRPPDAAADPVDEHRVAGPDGPAADDHPPRRLVGQRESGGLLEGAPTGD